MHHSDTEAGKSLFKKKTTKPPACSMDGPTRRNTRTRQLHEARIQVQLLFGDCYVLVRVGQGLRYIVVKPNTLLIYIFGLGAASTRRSNQKSQGAISIAHVVLVGRAGAPGPAVQDIVLK